jgi:putative component of membrane protein insertase Oxa1/YidC/SpoIIIJ protein YidD
MAGILTTLNQVIKATLVFILQGIRPLHHAVLGPATCRYPTACTQFAINQIQERSLPVALCNIIKRLLACNPANRNVD